MTTFTLEIGPNLTFFLGRLLWLSLVVTIAHFVVGLARSSLTKD